MFVDWRTNNNFCLYSWKW